MSGYVLAANSKCEKSAVIPIKESAEARIKPTKVILLIKANNAGENKQIPSDEVLPVALDVPVFIFFQLHKTLRF